MGATWISEKGYIRYDYFCRVSKCHNPDSCLIFFENENVACRKEHSSRSDCPHTPEFIQQPQAIVMEDPGKEMLTLSRGMGVAISTMNLALNSDLRCQSYERCKGQFLSPSDKSKGSSEQGESSCRTRNS